jgi:hypothetical protein
MTRDLTVDRSDGTVVLGWKTSEGGLLLRVRGEPEDVRLVCGCGRTHWIIREDDSKEGAVLILICHHDGTRITFPMERLPMAAPPPSGGRIHRPRRSSAL